MIPLISSAPDNSLSSKPGCSSRPRSSNPSRHNMSSDMLETPRHPPQGTLAPSVHSLHLPHCHSLQLHSLHLPHCHSLRLHSAFTTLPLSPTALSANRTVRSAGICYPAVSAQRVVMASHLALGYAKAPGRVSFALLTPLESWLPAFDSIPPSPPNHNPDALLENGNDRAFGQSPYADTGKSRNPTLLSNSHLTGRGSHKPEIFAGFLSLRTYQRRISILAVDGCLQVVEDKVASNSECTALELWAKNLRLLKSCHLCACCAHR